MRKQAPPPLLSERSPDARTAPHVTIFFHAVSPSSFRRSLCASRDLSKSSRDSLTLKIIKNHPRARDLPSQDGSRFRHDMPICHVRFPAKFQRSGTNGRRGKAFLPKAQNSASHKAAASRKIGNNADRTKEGALQRQSFSRITTLSDQKNICNKKQATSAQPVLIPGLFRSE